MLAVSCQVLIKRFCFRNSIEEAVVELHAKIKDGSVKLTDGRFPKEAKDLFKKHGVDQPHTFVPEEDGHRLGQSSAHLLHATGQGRGCSGNASSGLCACQVAHRCDR